MTTFTSITWDKKADHKETQKTMIYNNVLVCRFDKRITLFAEEKFQRDGIDLKPGSMVTKVTEKSISFKERSSGETRTLPFGMVVWSTGIGARPVIVDFMKQIGQVNCMFIL